MRGCRIERTVSRGFDSLTKNLFHFRLKPVTATWHRLNISRLPFRIAEGLSKPCDVEGDVALFDKNIRPESVENLLFCDDGALMSHQQEEGLESLRCYRHHPAFS